jgi:hypothetical protein
MDAAVARVTDFLKDTSRRAAVKLTAASVTSLLSSRRDEFQ